MEEKMRTETIRAERHNQGKPRWSLVSMKSLLPLVRVLEMGARKYADDNWKLGLKKREVLESAMRHLAELIDGEELDDESGLSHAGHVMANMMFYIYFNDNGWIDERDKEEGVKRILKG